MAVLRSRGSGPLPSGAFVGGLSASVDGNAKLTGTAAPGAVIEVNNLSTLPAAGVVVDDAVEVGRADANGFFAFDVASAVSAAAGDVLQVQVRDASGAVSSAVQLRVDASRSISDLRAALVRVDRLRIVGDTSGQTVTIEPRTRQPMTEPDAVVRFKNRRTGDSCDVVADPLGRLDKVTLAAAPGDVITVSVSDGTGNLDFAFFDGTMTAPTTTTTSAPTTPDPLAHHARSYLVPLTGPLIHPTGPRFPRQGQVGDCPVPAACAAVAAVDAQAIRDLIRPTSDGNFVVTFHPVVGSPVEVVVDNTVWAASPSTSVVSARYGTGGRDPQSGAVESWFPLVEKAYAAWVGGYEAVGRGTSVGKVLAELTGRSVRELWTNQNSPDVLWQAMVRARGNGQAIAAGTWPQTPTGRASYDGSGVHANHAYSVLDVAERNGQRIVTLRNPWGTGTPVGGGPDGVFEMKLDDFCSLFAVLNLC